MVKEEKMSKDVLNVKVKSLFKKWFKLVLVCTRNQDLHVENVKDKDKYLIKKQDVQIVKDKKSFKNKKLLM
jgi:hypothetical protein